MSKKGEKDSAGKKEDNQKETEKEVSTEEKKKKQKKTRSTADTFKKKLEETEEQNRELVKEVERFKEEYLRQLAEKENLRKRLEREKADYYDYALSEVLKELLAVLDNLERALESEDQVNGKSFREGVEMIYRQFQDFLRRQGVERIKIEGKKFDPQIHQAFMTEESEGVEEPQVGEELQKGYKLRSRLLRPALVKVLIPKKEK
ncbi:MAG: nucleotide exchange factor GrpE [Candidatus Aminicenantes bacterium]